MNNLPITLLEENSIITNAFQILSRRKSELENQVKQLQIVNKAQKPAVDFYNSVTDSKDAIEMSKVAKVIDKGYGRNQLFEILRNRQVLRKNNEPYQRYIDMGWFRVIEQKFMMENGDTRISIKTLVYQKGIQGIIKILETPVY